MGKNKENLLKKIIEAYPDEDILLATGFNDAIIGFTSDLVIVYSIQKCINILMSEHDMNYDDAVEFFYYNVEGSFVGEKTPIFINTTLNT